MPPSITIVVISGDIEFTNTIVKHINALGSHAGLVGTASSFESGFELIHKKRPMVVIMDINAEDIDLYITQVEKIINRFPRVSVFAASDDKSSDTILKIMRSGVGEYLLKPVSDVDLTSALQKIGRIWIAKTSPEAEEGFIYTCFSPKGGVGVTTIAINLAINIHQITHKPTLLVDLDLNAGDVSTFLNVKPTYTISDVTTNMSRLDKSFLKGVLTKHESGISLLAEPQKLEEAVSISPDDIRQVLSLLKTMFKYIIVDTEPVFNRRTMAAIELSELLFLTFCMSLPGIKNMQRYLNYLERVGINKNKIMMIVSRYLKKGDIKLEEAEKVLNHPIHLNIPNDYNTAISCLNKGVPVSTFDPKSKLNSALKELAVTIVARQR
jgi:pilus assembly protein CpaE